MKDLYNRVLPPLKRVEERVLLMSSEHEQNKEMIRRYDEVLAQKANKAALRELKEDADKTYAKMESVDRVRIEGAEKVDALKLLIKTLQDMLQAINDTIAKEIYGAVRKATNTLRAQLMPSNQQASGVGGLSNPGSGVGIDNNELR